MGQMGRNAVLWAAITGIGWAAPAGWVGMPAPFGGVRPAAAQQTGLATPVAPEAAGSKVDSAVVAQVRAAPGAPPPRHVLATQIDPLIDRVVALNEHYGWRWSETGALIASLEEAFLDLDNDNPQEAARQLTHFRDRISAGVADGTLAPEAGAPLLTAAADLLDRVAALGGAPPLPAPLPK
jgi:hypothetical protein